MESREKEKKSLGLTLFSHLLKLPAIPHPTPLLLPGLPKGTFLWDDLDQDQSSKITRIFIHHRNQ